MEKEKPISEWQKKISSENIVHGKWRDKGKAIYDRYKVKDQKNDSFNILYSNVQTLRSSVYSGKVNPDVRKRFPKKGELEDRSLAEAMERCLQFSNDEEGIDSKIYYCVDDLLVPGLGQVRLRYTPFFKEKPRDRIPLSITEAESGFKYMDAENKEYSSGNVYIDEEGSYSLSEQEEEKVYECVTTEVVPWDRFIWEPSKCWEDVSWAGIIHYLRKEDVEEQLGAEISEKISYEFSSNGEKEAKDLCKAKIYEIFDKKKRKIIILCDGVPDILKEIDDPLNLEGFYPFPEPLIANCTSSDLIPIADYIFYQSQALELESITYRINDLTNRLRFRIVYDSSFPTFERIANASDADSIPLEDFRRITGDNNLDSVFKVIPNDDLMKTISSLKVLQQGVKETIYEIGGISDVLRGQSDSSETLGAQQIKRNFASKRIDTKSRRVYEFIRNIMRIKSEIIVEQFSKSTIQIISGIDLSDEMINTMKNDMLRSYKIDVQTEETQDADQDQKNRIDMITAITSFVAAIGPAVEQGFMPIEVAKEIMLFGLRSFKGSREIEEVIEESSKKIQQTNNIGGAEPGAPEVVGDPNQYGASPGLQDINGIQ